MRAVDEESLPAPPENAESASNTGTVDDEEVISRRDPMVELLQGMGGESDDEYGQAENPRRDDVDTIIDIELQHYRSMKNENYFVHYWEELSKNFGTAAILEYVGLEVVGLSRGGSGVVEWTVGYATS